VAPALRALPATVAAFATASAFAGVVAGLTGALFAEALAAFSPVGLEAMTMMAFALGMDPLFVGSHHIARFLFISLALPWVARRIVERPVAPAAHSAENCAK
jgi:uncharacterized membrane protein AbrB (regulator of aidB expression)